MKKIVTIAVLLAATSAVQAGLMSWISTGIRDPAGNAISSTDNMYAELYYTTANDPDTSMGWDTVFATDGSGTKIKFGLITSVSSGSGAITASSGQLGYSVWDQDNFVENTDGSQNFYMKLYYSPTGVASPGNATYIGITHLYTAQVRNLTSANVSVTMSNISPTPHVSWTPVAVPEPATMALFGLGGLALVIRRKMRKEV